MMTQATVGPMMGYLAPRPAPPARPSLIRAQRRFGSDAILKMLTRAAAVTIILMLASLVIVLSRAAVCRIFGIPESRITDYVEFDPALAIKFTILRSVTSGSPGDADIFGSQQYVPLLEIAVPTE